MVTLTLATADGARAYQISAVPCCALARAARIQCRPPPETDAKDWAPERGPSAPITATAACPAPRFRPDGVVRDVTPPSALAFTGLPRVTTGSDDPAGRDGAVISTRPPPMTAANAASVTPRRVRN